MALDPKIYDVDAYQKAVDAWNSRNRSRAKRGKSPLDASTAPTGDKFIRPGQKPPPGSSPADVSGYNPAFGGIPGVPNPVDTTRDAIAGNLANFGDLESLTGKTNKLNFDEYTNRLPDYGSMSATSSANILANLRGEIPQDVINLLGQQAAERGIGSGVGGSQFSNADYLRSLGLTSLDLKSKGEAGFTGATDRLKGIPLFDPTSMFTKPEDIYTANLNRNILASAPNPAAAAANNLNMATLPFTNAANANASSLWEKEKEDLINRRRGQPGAFVGGVF